MYAVGHFALGYLAGKTTSKGLKVNLNMPLLLLASIVPDTDLIFERFLPTIFQHRVETHSIFIITVAMIPFFVIYRKNALPYYAALLSHSLIGDFFTGGVALLWPFTNHFYGFTKIGVSNPLSLVAEVILFAISFPIMIYSKDLCSLLKPRRVNLVLIVPGLAILVPMLQYGSRVSGEGSLPFLLTVPSLFWLIIIVYSILVELVTILKEKPG